MAHTSPTEAQPRTRKRPRGKKRKKNPGAPKNPRSAYLFYVAEQRPILAKDPTMNKYNFTDVARIIGKRWREMTKDERIKYDDLAKQDQRRYEKEKAVYIKQLQMAYLIKMHEEKEQRERERVANLAANAAAANAAAATNPLPMPAAKRRKTAPHAYSPTNMQAGVLPVHGQNTGTYGMMQACMIQAQTQHAMTSQAAQAQPQGAPGVTQAISLGMSNPYMMMLQSIAQNAAAIGAVSQSVPTLATPANVPNSANNGLVVPHAMSVPSMSYGTMPAYQYGFPYGLLPMSTSPTATVGSLPARSFLPPSTGKSCSLQSPQSKPCNAPPSGIWSNRGR